MSETEFLNSEKEAIPTWYFNQCSILFLNQPLSHGTCNLSASKISPPAICNVKCIACHLHETPSNSFTCIQNLVVSATVSRSHYPSLAGLVLFVAAVVVVAAALFTSYICWESYKTCKHNTPWIEPGIYSMTNKWRFTQLKFHLYVQCRVQCGACAHAHFVNRSTNIGCIDKIALNNRFIGPSRTRMPHTGVTINQNHQNSNDFLRFNRF